jgi:DNA recombination protein RmuC
MQILIFVAGCILGGVAIFLAMRGRLADLRKAVDEARDRENQANAKAAASAAEVTAALVEKAGALKEVEAANRRAGEIAVSEREKAEAIVQAKDEQIAKLNDFIAQAKEAMTTEFQAVSGGVLKDASEQLIKRAEEIIKQHGDKTTGDVALHKQQIETMLKPVEETMKRLDQHVETSNRERSNAETLLDEQIKRLAGASESLSSALRKPVIRGSWGEMTLENALENAGLRAEIDFVLQHSTDGEDGRKRTDAIINLPKGRKLIIDSKNLMESYIAYSITEDPAQKAVLQAAHARSLKNHIKDLSSKEYQERYDTPDCVILFIPHDGMYHAALQDEAELIREACERRVFVTNPMSLIPLLKAVGYVLDQERANKSAEAIKNVGAELYAQIARFAANMANIGFRLQASVKAYNDAIPGLDRYIVSKARTLKQLGAGKGADAELPQPVELEPRLFSSAELKTTNLFLQPDEDESELSLAASVEGADEER